MSTWIRRTITITISETWTFTRGDLPGKESLGSVYKRVVVSKHVSYHEIQQEIAPLEEDYVQTISPDSIYADPDPARLLDPHQG